MLLDQLRDVYTPTTTLSTLAVVYDGGFYFDGKRWMPTGPTTPGPTDRLPFGFVCEDEDRGLDAAMPLATLKRMKVPKETAIPTGRYRVLMRWSPKHGRRVPGLVKVLAFNNVEMHPGNSEVDTDACLLLGTQRDVRKAFVLHSGAACDWMTARIEECEARKEDVYVEIRRDPAAWALAPLRPR